MEGRGYLELELLKIEFKFFVPTFALWREQDNAILEEAALGKMFSHHVPQMFPNTVSTGPICFAICTPHPSKAA